jgi:glutathione S-transferase
VKLYYSATSPFVRKVIICAILRGLDGRIERTPSDPHASPADLIADNPLSKVPCLVSDEGVALFDSPMICEYLDAQGDAAALFPAPGPARWRALKQQAMGDGIMDAAVLRRGLRAKPVETARTAELQRQKKAVDRTLDQLEADIPGSGLDIGTIAIACALGYLDLRFADEPWRETRPALAGWFKAISAQPALVSTSPV